MTTIDGDSCDNVQGKNIESECSKIPEDVSDCSDESEKDSTAEIGSEDSHIPESLNNCTDESKNVSILQTSSENPAK